MKATADSKGLFSTYQKFKKNESKSNISIVSFSYLFCLTKVDRVTLRKEKTNQLIEINRYPKYFVYFFFFFFALDVKFLFQCKTQRYRISNLTQEEKFDIFKSHVSFCLLYKRR